MFNFIKVDSNTSININSISKIIYYPYGYKLEYDRGYYLKIYVNGDDIYEFNDRKEAMNIIEKLNQHGVFLE